MPFQEPIKNRDTSAYRELGLALKIRNSAQKEEDANMSANITCFLRH